MRNLQRSTGRRPASRIVQAESSGRKSVDQSRVRLTAVVLFFALCYGALTLRLIEVSVMHSAALPFRQMVSEPQLLIAQEEEVDAQAQGIISSKVRRDIVDRRGQVLATSLPTASLAANPTLIRHEHEVAAALAALLPGVNGRALESKFKNKRTSFLYVKRHLTPAQQEAVNRLGVPGLFFEADTRRVYPYGALLAHVLGFVGVDNQGLSGLERGLDKKLREPWHEKPLALSLDVRVQAMLHEELTQAVKTFRAIGAAGVVADVHTGEIIALVSLPDFNPNQPQLASEEARFNRVTLGAYEMGSVFKTFTSAAALKHGTATMHSGYDATQPIEVARFTISDTHPKNRWLSVPEIFAYSSNIGTVKMAMDVGTKRLKAFLGSLGMYSPVTTELGEAAQPLAPRQWQPINTMTISYGHGISVSPLHVVRAFSAIAGDGHMRPLTFMKHDAAAKKHHETGEAVLARAQVAQVRKLLRLVVAHGTAKSANAAGYSVGGKTGTAEKVSGRGYKADAKLANFVGVFPAHKPRYTILVMVDEPTGTKETYGYATGGWVSAPVVGRFVERAAPVLGIAPSWSTFDSEAEALWADLELKAAARMGKPKGVQNAAY